MRTKEKGITLVALVVTIIILLILAGVTISALAGENGLFEKAKKAEDKNNLATATEILKLKIDTYIVESYANNQNPSLQRLAIYLKQDEEIQYVEMTSQKNSIEKNDKIEKDNEFEGATKIYTKLVKYPYEFEIGEDLKIISVDGIVEIEKPEVTLENPIITVDEILANSFRVNITNNNSEIQGIKYDYYINGEKKIENTTSLSETISDLSAKTQYTVQVYLIYGENILESSIVTVTTLAIEEPLEYPLLTSDGIQNYKNTLTGNYEFSIDVDCTALDALGKGAYDNDDTTFAGYYNLETGNPGSGTKSEIDKYVQIDSSAIGKELSIDWSDDSSLVTITMQTLNSSKNVLTTLEQANGKHSTDRITITSDMKWIRFRISEGMVSHGRVYEMYYDTKVALDYPLVTTTGIVNYLDSKTGKYGLDTNINCTASDALPVQCYDGNESTYVSMIPSNILTTGKLKLSDEFKKSGYNLRFKATLISGTQSGVYIQCGSTLNNLGNYKYWNDLTKSGSYYLVDNVIDECYYIWFTCISNMHSGYNLYEVYYK